MLVIIVDNDVMGKTFQKMAPIVVGWGSNVSAARDAHRMRERENRDIHS